MKRNILLIGWLLGIWLGVSSARAHGGGELVAGLEPVGPYAVSVWINPPQPRVGSPLHFTVGVASGVDGAPVLDANVTIEMHLLATETAVDPDAAIMGTATTDQSTNKLFYETDVDVLQKGVYVTEITVQGREGSGALQLEVGVAEPAGTNWLMIGLGGLVLLISLGLFWSYRQQQTPVD